MKSNPINKVINIALLVEQLKRFWPISAIAMLGYLILVIPPIYFQGPNAGRWRIAQAMVELLSMGHPAMMIAMVAVPFCTVLVLFSYPFRVASVSAYHSFPINRTQLFFTQSATGLVLMLTPLLILSLILLVPVDNANVDFHAAGNLLFFQGDRIFIGQTINTFGRVVGFFLRNALGFTLYFAVFMLAASLSGNWVMTILMSLAIALAPMGVVGLIDVISTHYIFGFSLSGFGALTITTNAMTTVFYYSHPLSWFMAFRGSRAISLFFVTYGLITIIAFSLSFMAYRLRPLESSGDAVAFKSVRRVFIFLLSVLGMITLGVFMLFIMSGRIGLYFGFVIGFVVAYFIAQMISENTFRVGHKTRQLFSYGAVMLGIYITILLVTGLGFWGYVRRVPEVNEIAGVWVQEWHWNANPPVFIDDPETIQWARDIHQNILNERTHLQRSLWDRHALEFGRQPFIITYQLTDGTVIQRRYTLTSSFYNRHNTRDIFLSIPVILSFHPTLAYPEVIDSIEIYISRERDWMLFNEIDIARHRADFEGVSIEEILGERVEILNHYVNRRHIIHDPALIAGLTAALLEDIGHPHDGSWRDFIDVNISVRPEYADQNWARQSFGLTIGASTGQWLSENGFIMD